MNIIFWTGYCNRGRYAAISEIEKIVDDYGYITDFKQFSDISISIKIELEELNIDKLYSSLKNYLSLNDFVGLNSKSNKERIIYLNVTFIEGKGDLRIKTPSVPG